MRKQIRAAYGVGTVCEITMVEECKSSAGMFGFFFAKGPITCFEEAASQVDLKKFGRFHRGMVSTQNVCPPTIMISTG